jgi:hypothetical protein
MVDRADLLRIDSTGAAHPVGKTASQELRSRTGEWQLMPSPPHVLLLRQSGDADVPVMKLAGEITSPGSICDVIALTAQSGWGGELMVLTEGATRSIFFEGGNVVGAVTSVPEERIGETLYRFGVVTREQLETMIEAAQRTGKRVGEAAVELGFVTAGQLFPMMARQVEEVFFKAMQVGDGIFYFFDRFDDTQLVRRHNMNAGALLMEGARRMDEMRYFREKIPSDLYVPSQITESGEKPPADLLDVYTLCDGRRSIEEIGRSIGQLEFEVTRAVFQLIGGGFLHVNPPRPRGPEAIVEVFNPALAEIHRRCDAADKGTELREGLARFATGGGIFDPLFQSAGPLPDGTLKPERVAKNLVALAGEEPDTWLAQQLYEYAGFALFQAGSLLPRDTEAALNATVAELLKPLRQSEGGARSPRRPSQAGTNNPGDNREPLPGNNP